MNDTDRAQRASARLDFLGRAVKVADRGFESILKVLFFETRDPSSRALGAVWYLALFCLGGFMWWYSLNGGAIQLNLHDWVEAGKRYAILKDAVLRGLPPLHAPGTSALRGVTDRFLSVVDTNTSPQVLLLRYLDIGEFVLANTLLLYALGFVCLLALSRKVSLSPVAFAAAFFLLFFNGHVTTHIAVGHVHWAAYLLIPGFILLVIEILDGRRSWALAASGAFLLSFLVLQGAYHLFVMCLLFMGLLLLAVPRLWQPILAMSITGTLLSAPRLLPPLLDAARFDTEFLSGFVSSIDLVSSLVVLVPPVKSLVFSQNPLTTLGWWEYDYYIGLVGLALLLGPGIAQLRSRAGRWTSLRVLAGPMAMLVFLSIGRVYKLAHVLHLPLLSSQRVSSRLYILPLAFLVVLGCIQVQHWVTDRRPNRWSRLGLLALLAILVNDTWQHLKLWRVVRMGALFPPTPLDLSRFYVANHADPAYLSLITVGLAVSGATLAGLLVLVLLERRKRAASP